MLIKQIKEILHLRNQKETDASETFTGFADSNQRWINGRKRLDVCLQRIAKLDTVKQKSDEFFYFDSAKQIQYEYCMLLAKQLLKSIMQVLVNNKFQDLLNQPIEQYLNQIFDQYQNLQSEQEIDTRKYLFEIVIKYFQQLQLDYLKKIVNQSRQLEYYVNQMSQTILEQFYESYIVKSQADDYAIKLKEQKRKILQSNPKDQNSLITSKLREQLPLTNVYSMGYENKEVNVFCALSNDEQYGKVLEEALLFDSFYCDKLQMNQQCHNQKQRKLKPQSHKYSKSELEHFINQYKVSQIRMSKKNIGEMNKTDYSNHYYQTREQRIKSEQNKSRIIEVTDKVNKIKINTIQQFFQNDLEIKKQENKEVIDFLVNYNYKKVPKTLQNFIYHQSKEEDNTSEAQELLHKAFFKFSNKQDEDSSKTFQFMNCENFISLCKELQVKISNDQLFRIYHKCLEDQSFFSEKGLTFSFFQDSILMISTVLNDTDTNAPEQFMIDQNRVRFKFSKKEIEQNNDPQLKINKFMQMHIYPYQQQIYEPLDWQLQNCEYYEDFNKTFQPLILEFFNGSQKRNEQFINFDEIVKQFMLIKLCPSKITKATLRYYYNYSQLEDEGLTLQQFHHFLNMLALLQQKKSIISKDNLGFIQYYTYIFEQKSGIKKDTITTYKKIMIFYIQKDYLRLLKKTPDFDRKESMQE